MSGLLIDPIFLILQFLNEQNYKEAAHRLESESGLFLDVNYIEELVVKGDWDNLEKYLAGFIRVGDDKYSVKMLFEIRKQKYLEALDKNERYKALDILNEELKVFKPFNGELFTEMTKLLTIENIRENAQLSTYTDDVKARGELASMLKELIYMNPELNHKCQFPTVDNSTLRSLVNQSLKWQHQAARGQVPVANGFSSTLRSGGLQLPIQPPEVPIYLGTSSRAQGTFNSLPFTPLPNSRGGPILAAHNNEENQLVSRRSRSFDLSNEIRNLPTSSVSRPGQINGDNLVASGSGSKPPTFNIASSLPPGVILALPASTSRTNMASQAKFAGCPKQKKQRRA